MMVKKAKEEVVAPLKVGDKVVWRGHELTVHEIDDRGYVTALSLQLRVVTDEPDKTFTRL